MRVSPHDVHTMPGKRRGTLHPCSAPRNPAGPSHVTALRQAYPQAPGYPHCVVQVVLDPAFFRGLREEVVGSLGTTSRLYPNASASAVSGSPKVE
jgi:hypothetical protein